MLHYLPSAVELVVEVVEVVEVAEIGWVVDLGCFVLRLCYL